MKKLVNLFICMTALGFTSTSFALPILYSPGSGLHQVEVFEPIGQTFVAEDAFIEAGLYFAAINPGFANTDDIKYELFEGAGVGGTLLDSAIFSLATGYVGFYLEDFSSIALNIGDTYSLVASVVGTSPHWGVGQTSDPGAPNGILNGSISTAKFALSVNPVSVPEPAMLSLIGLGLLGFGFARRRA